MSIGYYIGFSVALAAEHDILIQTSWRPSTSDPYVLVGFFLILGGLYCCTTVVVPGSHKNYPGFVPRARRGVVQYTVSTGLDTVYVNDKETRKLIHARFHI